MLYIRLFIRKQQLIAEIKKNYYSLKRLLRCVSLLMGQEVIHHAANRKFRNIHTLIYLTEQRLFIYFTRIMEADKLRDTLYTYICIVKLNIIIRI